MTKDNTFMVKDLLKDLCKDLCVVVERNSKEFEKNLKELEVYKKALELACEQLWDDFDDCDNCPVKNNGDKCSTNYCGVTSYDLMNYFLKEARKEE